jgi:hypothetical protein
MMREVSQLRSQEARTLAAVGAELPLHGGILSVEHANVEVPRDRLRQCVIVRMNTVAVAQYMLT